VKRTYNSRSDKLIKKMGGVDSPHSGSGEDRSELGFGSKSSNNQSPGEGRMKLRKGSESVIVLGEVSATGLEWERDGQ